MLRRRLLLLPGMPLGKGGDGPVDIVLPDPDTGTLYTGYADGTITWTVEQPTSPEVLTQQRGGFRVDDISTDGLGLVRNGWEWTLERAVDGTWTFRWYSVTNGEASGAIQTLNNIGTVVNVRAVLNANSIEMYTSANGVNYTARGSTTSASFQTETGVTGSYTGATGSNLLTNGDFEATPVDDGWTKEDVAVLTSAAAPSPGGGTQSVEIFNDAVGYLGLAQNVGSITNDNQYLMRCAVKTITGTAQLFFGGGTFPTRTFASAEWAIFASRRNPSATFTPTCALRSRGSLASVCQFDNVAMYLVGTLDDSGDGEISEILVQL